MACISSSLNLGGLGLVLSLCAYYDSPKIEARCKVESFRFFNFKWRSFGIFETHEASAAGMVLFGARLCLSEGLSLYSIYSMCAQFGVAKIKAAILGP